jgi:hypothetical protein
MRKPSGAYNLAAMPKPSYALFAEAVELATPA